MEFDNLESVLVESNSRFLNKAFVKGFLAGIVIGLGFLISGAIGDFVEPYMFESVDSRQILLGSIIYVVMPLLIIYLVGSVVKFALGKFGFEGWTKGRMNFVHLLGAYLGFFLALISIGVLASILEAIWTFIVTGNWF